MAVEPTSTMLPQGSVLGGCRIIRPIGKGGMGEVYLAQHLMLQKNVALKVLPPSKLDREHIARFLREARTCSQIEHSNVVTIYNVGEENGCYFIVMQYVKGKNLTEVVETQGGPLPWRTALKIIRLAARGVDAVHSRELLHRDIKPSNIMVREDASPGDDSKVLLMDFGLVREEAESDLTHSGAILGTPVFMAPEQCRGEETDLRSDIYALGATLYYVLTGKLPFTGSVQSVLMQIAGGKRPPAPHHVNPYVPRSVSKVVEKAMAPRRDDRFADARSFGQALQRQVRQKHTDEAVQTNTSHISGDNTADVRAVTSGEIVPELELIRNIPTKTREESLRRVLPWAVGGAGVLLLVVLGLVLNAVFGTKPGTHGGSSGGDRQQANRNTNGNAPPANRNRNNEGNNRPPPNVDVSGMVRIPAGEVQLGSRAEDIKAHFNRALDSDIAALEAQGVKITAELRNQIRAKVDQAVQLLKKDPLERRAVPEFWIDKYEVTNAQYARFVRETEHTPPAFWNGNQPPGGKENHPVTQVTYDDATAYAEWAGKKLPTLAQWVRAFRGNSDSMYPWGNEPQRTWANTGENPGDQGTSSVTATPKDRSPYDVYNLLGNVREYVRETPLRNGITYVILKGADWSTPASINGLAPLRFMYPQATVKANLQAQAQAGQYLHQLGFRCVYEPPAATSR